MMRSMMDGIWNNRVEPHGEITEKRQTVRKDGTQSQGAKAGTTERTQPSQPSCQNFNLKSERKIEKMAKKKLQKLFAILLAGSMTMGIASTAALAVEYDLEQGSVYVDNDQDGEGDYSWQKTRDEVTKDTADRTYVKEDTSNDGKIIINQGVDSKSGSEKEATTNTVQVGENVQGVTITLDDVNVQAGEGESAVEIGAGSNVQIEVSGENILKGGTNGAGIAVPGKVVLDDTVPDEAEPGDAVLNLSSDKAGGTLTAIGNGGVNTETTSGAGIGGTASQGTSGIINIEGLKGLTAEGYGIHASGIGSALDGSSGAITITDSTVDKVTGGFEENELQSKYGNSDPEGGAAIGGGGKGGTCGDITITDSTISSAHGGSKATAIGGSCWADVGNITITDSVLKNVVGGSSSAGIGVGRVSTSNDGDSAYKANANITITGSTVKVTGGEYGAGIGTGYNGNSIGNQKDKSLKDQVLAPTTITIKDSTVTAIGGNGGAGIGGGYKGWNTDITIQGGTVYAQSGVVHNADENGDSRYGMSVYTERVKNGASAIGTGANGSGKFEGGKITIDGDAKVIAVSNGGKWAIDLTCDVSGVVSGYQNMFLSDGSETTYSGEQVKNPVDVCETVPYKNEYVVYMNGQKIVLPANFLCAAVTTGGADGVFHTTNEDGTWYFSHYGTVGSDSEEDRAAYGKADTVEKLGTVTVEMTVTGDLAANSYLHVALRPNSEVPPPVPTPGPGPGTDPGTDPDPDPGTDPDEDTPTIDIPDGDVPLTDIPTTDIPTTDIPDEDEPLTDIPTTDIPDEDVPLSDVPKTGDMSALWLALSALSGTGLAGVSLLGRKKQDEE